MVVDYRKIRQPPQEAKGYVYEVQVEWRREGQDPQAERYSWVPLQQVYKDFPQETTEFFKQKRIDFELILKEEMQACGRLRRNSSGQLGGRNFDAPEPIKRTFEDMAKKTLSVTHKYQLTSNFDPSARDPLSEKNKKKRQRRFEDNGDSWSTDRVKQASELHPVLAQKVQNQKQRAGRLQRDLKTDKMLAEVEGYKQGVTTADHEMDALLSASLELEEPSSSRPNFLDLTFDRQDATNSMQASFNEFPSIPTNVDVNYSANYYTKDERKDVLKKLERDRKPAPVQTNTNWLKELKGSPAEEEKLSEGGGKQPLSATSDKSCMIVDSPSFSLQKNRGASLSGKQREESSGVQPGAARETQATSTLDEPDGQLHPPTGPQMKVGFIPPSTARTEDGVLDCPGSYPNLTQKMGNPFSNEVKMIHGMNLCPKTGQVLYLCSWKQDLDVFYYTPSWVLGQALLNESGYKLIAEFYQHFAEQMEPVNGQTDV